MDFYIGSIWSFGFGWAPRGMALCNGQLVPIAQNEALFSLIGTTYGGDGQTTFGLPNMQGRVPIGTGTGPGLPTYVIGQAAGSETVTLTTSNLPMHTHPLLSANLPVGNSSDLGDPTNAFYSLSDSTVGAPYSGAHNVAMGPVAPIMSGITGSSQPISILSPFQVVSYCICTEGIYPMRN